jgi:hypothetical protein
MNDVLHHAEKYQRRDMIGYKSSMVSATSRYFYKKVGTMVGKLIVRMPVDKLAILSDSKAAYLGTFRESSVGVPREEPLVSCVISGLF